MSVTVAEIFSDFNAEILDFTVKPTEITDARKIRLLNGAERIFAKDGKAYNDIMVRNIEADKGTYSLPDNLISVYKVEYDGAEIFERPSNIVSATAVKYYDLIDKKIVLTGTPDTAGDGLLKVYYFRLPLLSLSTTSDEIELLNKHSEYHQSLVAYLMFRVLKNKKEYRAEAGDNWNIFSESVSQCKDKQYGLYKSHHSMRLGY